MKKQEELREISEKDLKERLEAETVALTQLKISHTITPLDDSGSIRENVATLPVSTRSCVQES